MKKTLLLIATLACAALANAAGNSDALSVLNTFIATYAKDNPAWKSNLVLLSDPSAVPAGRQLGYSTMIGYYSFEPKTWEDLTDTQKKEIYEDSRLKPFLVSLRNPSNYPSMSNADVPVPYEAVYPVEGLSAPVVQKATPKSSMGPQPTGVRPMMQVVEPQMGSYPNNAVVLRQMPVAYQMENVPMNQPMGAMYYPAAQPMPMPQAQQYQQAPYGYQYQQQQMPQTIVQPVAPAGAYQMRAVPQQYPQSFQPNASNLNMQQQYQPQGYYQPEQPISMPMQPVYNTSALNTQNELYQPVADYKAPTAKSAPQPASVKIAPEEMILDRPLQIFLHNNR